MKLRPLRPDPFKDPTLDWERAAFASSGAEVIIGLDEVGRGAIAGPVAVGAHVLLPDTVEFPEGLRDSKLLSAARREALTPVIDEWGRGAVGYATAEEIDQFGIIQMLGHAARRALVQLHDQGVPIAHALILVDGAQDWLTPVLGTPLRVQTRVGADRECASVAAASVRAKCARDAVMSAAHEEYPPYSWHSNKGYGSQAHYEAISANGLSPLHRVTWVKKAPRTALTWAR